IGINDDSGRADPFNARLLDRNLIEGVENAIASKGAGGVQSGSICLHRYGVDKRWSPFASDRQWLWLTNSADPGRPVNVLRINVEGYEPAVIACAMKTLDRLPRPFWSIRRM